MTAIDERSGTDISTAPVIPAWPATSSSMPHPLQSPPPAPQRGPARSQGEAELKTLRIASFAATAITALIAIASFVLSFSSLWDLASRSVSWPRGLAWLWPLIVDGVVVVATIAIRALTTTAAPSNERLGAGAALADVMTGGDQESEVQHRRDRAFFWSMLMAAASVSVVGNGLHSLLPAGQPLSPWLSVVIGCVPACALLATTHALQRLSRLRIRPAAQMEDSDALDARANAVAVRRADKWHAVAAGIHDRGLLTSQSTDTLAAAMTFLFDVKPTPSLRSIAAHIGVTHHDVVGRVRDAALLVLDDAAGQ